MLIVAALTNFNSGANSFFERAKEKFCEKKTE
jgi:hypothetical protein